MSAQIGRRPQLLGRRLRWLALAIVLAGAAPARLALAQGDDPGAAVEHPADERGENGASEVEHEEGPPPINFYHFGQHRGQTKDPQPPFLFALFNFAVLMFILAKLAGPPLGKFIRERSSRMARDLDDAARMKKEAEAKLAEYEAKLARLDQDVAALAAEIRAEAEEEKQKILAAAEAQATRMTQDAQRTIEAEIARARALLELEAVSAAIAAAEKLIRTKINAEDQKALAEKFIAEVGRKAPRAGGAA